MRPRWPDARLAWAAAAAAAVVAEVLALPGTPIVFDAAAGAALLAGAYVCLRRARDDATGLLLAGAAAAWFLGTMLAPAATLHRGPLAHAVLVDARGRRGRREAFVVALAYSYAAIEPLGQSAVATAVVALLVVTTTALRRPVRPAQLGAAVLLAAALLLSAAERVVTLPLGTAAELRVYDVLVAALAVAVVLRRGRRGAAIANLAADLGAALPLRDRIAAALGDDSLEIGYWLASESAYVNERGERIALDARPGRRVTQVARDGRPLAILVHDPDVVDDDELLDDVAAVASLALANVELQAELRRRVDELSAARRRIVAAADAQRARLDRALSDGPERRLDRVADLLARVEGRGVARVQQDLADARAELRRFARGLHPQLLAERGLQAALADLAARAPVRVEVDCGASPLPESLETTAYYVCAEGIANATKHASAQRVLVRVEERRGRVVVVIDDDGAGGADAAAGSGLRGLADRVAAEGGTFRVESRRLGGTRLVAELPAAH